MATHPKKRYPQEFKLRILSALNSGDGSVTKLAETYKIPPRLIWAWRRASGGEISQLRSSPLTHNKTYALIKFAVAELKKPRVDNDVVLAYLTLARQSLEDKS